MYSKRNMKTLKTLNTLNFSKVYDSLNSPYYTVLLFILFITLFPDGYIVGIKRIVVTFVLALMLAYCITHNWKKSSWIALIFTMVAGLLDSNGPFSDYRINLNQYESFEGKDEDKTEETEKTGKTEKTPLYSSTETEETDNTNFDEDDLDNILKEDEKQSTNEYEYLKTAGGGLEQLKDLLDAAKKESPHANKNMNEYTPAQAQRATHNLIDTVQQLKETMTGMMPLMKAGGNLIKLHKQMGGGEFTKSLLN